MNTICDGLLARLEGFEISEQGAALPFTARLARENGWTSARAGRVVREYKRFLFLTAAAGHPVTPSEDVDQAWHLHMVYTRSYWDRLCGGLLGRPLHHEPTAGGSQESAKFHDWYVRTLDSYRRLIGEEPPVDIWPAPKQRFSHAGEGRWVDGSQYWLIRKPFRFSRRVRTLALLTASMAGSIALFLTGCVPAGFAFTSPFDWTGGPFLLLYGVGYVLALIWACSIRRKRTAAFEPVEPPDILTDPYEVAMLAKGGPRVMQTALASLVKADALVYETKETKHGKLRRTGKLIPGEYVPEHLHPVERAVLHAARKSPAGIAPAKLLDSANHELAAIEHRLAEWGLKPSTRDHQRAAGAVMVPLLLLLAVGVVKLVLGISRHRPVAFLAVCLVLTLITAVGLHSSVKRITAAGRAFLETLMSLRGRPDEAPAFVSGLSYSVALLGIPALEGVAGMEPLLKDLKQHMHAHNSSGGSGCGSSGCGSSGCGGGGCGGGCGGCGG
ncbi:MAG TPA: TIGR04222 domain-containing membrane protein [Verrucomicrobiales bacterium]|jgi:uncharacterized protein (TIGR04222 family)|nr:TIGR04222 domain-containing membrane protein [Verrucomicrobiales bacterium]